MLYDTDFVTNEKLCNDNEIHPQVMLLMFMVKRFNLPLFLKLWTDTNLSYSLTYISKNMSILPNPKIQSFKK